MENSVQEFKEKSRKSFWLYLVLLIVSFCLAFMFPVFYGSYERTGNVVFVVVSWALAVSSVVTFFYVIRSKAEVVGFFAFFHALFLVLVFFLSSLGTQLTLRIFERNIFFILFDGLVLGVVFFISLVKLKQAINKKNSKEIIKFALFSFFSMILSPLSFFIVIYGVWAINGD